MKDLQVRLGAVGARAATMLAALSVHASCGAGDDGAPVVDGGAPSDSGSPAGANDAGGGEVVAPWVDVTNRYATRRAFHGMAYDAARQRVVMFGGNPNFLLNEHRDEANLGDTWEWNGITWEEVTPASGSPPERREHALVYDAGRQRVVLFGGVVNQFDALNDTWEWDGEAWHDLTPASADDSPPAASQRGMAYDAARERVVLVTGGETWEWDGETWHDVTPASADDSPPAADRSVGYDATRERVLLLTDGETWEWDGEAWHDVTPESGRPRGRSDEAMAYDAARGEVVLFGGRVQNAGLVFFDTWAWDGAQWREHELPGVPTRTTIAYDSARERLVLRGAHHGSSATRETWERVGVRWVKVTADSGGPDHGRMAYDAERQRVVLFGAGDDLDETWTWDGQEWERQTPERSPRGRRGFGITYDAAHGRVVIFGGTLAGPTLEPLGDTWAWDGESWEPVSSPPPARSGPRLVYHGARQRVVLFGGSRGGAFTDMWELDGDTWEEITPDSDVPRVTDVAYHAARERLVAIDSDARTWEWDGDAWADVTPQDSEPRPALSGRLAYDNARQRVVLVGVSDEIIDGVRVYLNDTWEWSGPR